MLYSVCAPAIKVMDQVSVGGKWSADDEKLAKDSVSAARLAQIQEAVQKINGFVLNFVMTQRHSVVCRSTSKCQCLFD